MGCLLKNIFFLLITICLAVSFQGCSSEENIAVAGSNSNHFEADIQENLRVDANVEIPDGVVVPAIYEVKLAAPGEKGIETFLTEMGDTILNRNVSDLDDSQQIFAQTAKGTFVLNRTFSQKYQGCSFYYDTEMDSAYKSSYVLNYYGFLDEDNVRRTGNKVFRHNAQRYWEAKEFAFATAEEAELTVRGALEMLDVHDLILSEILYLDHSTMAQVEAETFAAAQSAMESGDEVFAKDPEGNYIQGDRKDIWTEADDCYMFVFSGGADGIPIVRGSEVENTTFFLPTRVCVRYNAQGIIHLEALNPWNVGGKVEIPDEMLSAGQALNQGIDILKDILVKEDQVVTRLSLRYYCKQDKNRWIFTPVWEITVCRKNVVEYYTEPMDLYYYIWIDAITGEEI